MKESTVFAILCVILSVLIDVMSCVLFAAHPLTGCRLEWNLFAWGVFVPLLLTRSVLLWMSSFNPYPNFELHLQCARHILGVQPITLYF
jgi:hypothetical protein